MTKTINYLLRFSILVLFYSCANNATETASQKQSNTNKSDSVHLLKSVYQTIANKDTIIFKVNSYSNNEVFLRVENSNGYLLSAAGATNIELIADKSNNVAQKIEFSPGDSCFSVDFFYKGSTYGANMSIVIWYGYGKWNTFVLPFERFEIKDTDNDSLYEILNYDNSKMERYKFNLGSLQKL